MVVNRVVSEKWLYVFRNKSVTGRVVRVVRVVYIKNFTTLIALFSVQFTNRVVPLGQVTTIYPNYLTTLRLQCPHQEAGRLFPSLPCIQQDVQIPP
jgi:hypothetical protein